MNADMKKSCAPVATAAAIRKSERGAALAFSLVILGVLGVISMSVLALVSTEARIAGSDLCRTQTFYATSAGIEKMTNDFSALFGRTSRPTLAQLDSIELASPPELVTEGFRFNQNLQLDTVRLAEMRDTQGISTTAFPVVTIQTGPFAGLIASVAPYMLTSTATSDRCGGQVSLQREINNYMIPLFQFGMFSDKDIELHPGPAFTFNGRVHANGNIYVNGNVRFLAKVTTANEFVRDLLRNGSVRTGSTVSMQVGAINVPITSGSVINGPNFPSATVGNRGYFPGSPNGSANAGWNSSTAQPQTGVANRFGGQLQTRTTGAAALLLPLQLDGNSTREIIKRQMPNDDQTLTQSRYHSKSQIRILLDDEIQAIGDASGIPAGRGVKLSQFDPMSLGGGKALWKMDDTGNYIDTASTAVKQEQPTGSPVVADTVRGVKPVVAQSAGGVKIPAGSGLSGRIMIEIVDGNGNARDVTREILSMGMTVGEPNAIVNLQRPLWAAFTQGSRDASGGNNYLTYLMANTIIGSDGQVKITSSKPALNGTSGYITQIEEDGAARKMMPPSITDSTNYWNSIVPINIYNVREGFTRATLDARVIYERGMTSIVELNMKNLARWVDGVYDNTLLNGTNARSSNINGQDGYIIYISDRRGDKVKAERDAANNLLMTTNGNADNEDIYGPNGQLDPGEDVIDNGLDVLMNRAKKGSLQKDVNELPDPAPYAYAMSYCGSGTSQSERFCRAKVAAWWQNPNIFRRSVRLFNGEDMLLSGAANKLSNTKGISVATENMVYIWGNFNTTGINIAPPAGVACLNDLAAICSYRGDQIPASIVADAFFPLSKTWSDSEAAMYPDDLGKRSADEGASVGQETAVRAGIIAGNNQSAISGDPDADNGADSRLSGGIHNFPRFLEDWLSNDRRWNFVGSFVPLYHSTQAMGPWQYPGTLVLYGAPIRNWAFDETFREPDRLPPGTPSFQHIEPTGFRQVVQGG